MIPETPQVITAPFAYNGDIRNIPQSTPLGSNQFSFESGFPVLTQTPLNAGGLPPERTDFNSAFNLLSKFIYYMQSGNLFVWNTQLDYNAGAFVLGSDGAVYYCLKANGATSPNTVQNPVSSVNYWVKLFSSNGQLNTNIVPNKSIKGTQLADNTITSSNLAANAVNANAIANGAVTVEKLSPSVIFNLPVGFIYIQLRNQSTPDQLFGTSGKWQDISSTYAGEFFRAVGGNSGSFGSTQAEGLPNITGSFATRVNSDLGWRIPFQDLTGSFYGIDAGSGLVVGGSQIPFSTSTRAMFLASYSSSIYGASPYVTPYNSAVRIWKKIA